jgi:glycosyltransferase involved in cell wall biosynthesis
MCRLVFQAIKINARYNFLCHYERFEIFILALALRIFGRRVFIMSDSKFDDRQRSLWKEIPKLFFFLPYCGGLVSGRRAREYVMFLGMGGRPISEGYDTLSIKRVRAAAGPLDDVSFLDRRFIVVARLVAKKNLSLLLAAYDLYRKRVGESARELVIVGDGPLEQALKAEVAVRNLRGVIFKGFLQADGVAQELSRGLALILPSIEEQWGLVINEALALGLPVMCSRNTGACDALIRNGINGYIFEHDDIDGLVAHMEFLTRDESNWRLMSRAAWNSAEAGDVAQFVEGIQTLIKAAP